MLQFSLTSPKLNRGDSEKRYALNASIKYRKSRNSLKLIFLRCQSLTLKLTLKNKKRKEKSLTLRDFERKK